MLQKFGPFETSVARSFLAQVLDGLAYLHANDIVHRDIKGANILLDSCGVIKLADFGAGKQLSAVRSISSGGCDTFTGSPYWMAPEVIQGDSKYGTKADMWSVGALTLEMLTGKPPFAHLEPMMALFKVGTSEDLPEIPEAVAPLAREFMSQCFVRSPELRPSAKILQQHAFLGGVSQRGREEGSSSESSDHFRFALTQHKSRNGEHATGNERQQAAECTEGNTTIHTSELDSLWSEGCATFGDATL